jgi:hypothetical protein
VQISEQCDRCHSVYTQKVADGDTVHSQLHAFWRIADIFSAPGQARKSVQVVPDIVGPRLQDRAYRVVPEASRICSSCASDYRTRLTAFALDWFGSYRPETPDRSVGIEADELADDRNRYP